ncbi:MAG: histidine triad nucleotide-binding protein [Acidimicrobiia bacterium]
MSQPSAPADCIFCRIVAGEIPATVVAESERSLAFRDLNPQAPTHVLVVPKRHLVDASTVDAEVGADVADLVVTAQRVAAGEGIAERGYRLVFNVGRDAGNSVPHLHLHVVGGQPLPWPPWAGSSGVPK